MKTEVADCHLRRIKDGTGILRRKCIQAKDGDRLLLRHRG